MRCRPDTAADGGMRNGICRKKMPPKTKKNPQIITKLVGEMCGFAQNSLEKYVRQCGICRIYPVERCFTELYYFIGFIVG